MKVIFTLLLALLTLGTRAQATVYTTLPRDSASQKVVYRGSWPLPAGVSQSQAFGRAKIWLSDAFVNHELLAEDATTGLINGGGVLPIQKFAYSFRVRLQVGPNSVKYRLDDFTWLFSESGTPTDRGTVEQQRDSKLKIGKASRAKLLAELDGQVRDAIIQLGQELAGTL